MVPILSWVPHSLAHALGTAPLFLGKHFSLEHCTPVHPINWDPWIKLDLLKVSLGTHRQIIVNGHSSKICFRTQEHFFVQVFLVFRSQNISAYYQMIYPFKLLFFTPSSSRRDTTEIIMESKSNGRVVHLCLITSGGHIHIHTLLTHQPTLGRNGLNFWPEVSHLLVLQPFNASMVFLFLPIS